MRFRFPHFIIPRGNRLESTNIYVQPPRYRDWRAWAALRSSSREFLTPWEPTWPRGFAIPRRLSPAHAPGGGGMA